jgi:hypothetical protein
MKYYSGVFDDGVRNCSWKLNLLKLEWLYDDFGFEFG